MNLKHVLLAGLTLAMLGPALADPSNQLCEAAAKGDLNEVRAYVQQDRRHDICNFRINSIDGEDLTALHRAAENGHVDVVNWLIAHHACLNPRPDVKQITPLWLAAKNGHLDCVKALVEAGAKIDAADRRGHTPLYAAAKKGHLDVVQYLVGKTARMDIEDEHGHTPLYTAAKHGQTAVVEFLLAAGSPIGNFDVNRHKVNNVAKDQAILEMIAHRGLH